MLFRKLLVLAFVVAFSATAASAYTLVMRSGRRVEIPNTFTLSKSTLTYETAPGIQVSVQLVSIDVDATERVNGQPAGTFLASAAERRTPAAVQTQRRTTARSVTNNDLEAFRRARIENERQRQELGLPSVEDRRREVEEIDNRTQEQIRDMRSREELEFWRDRAMSLETQLSGTAAQTNAPPMYDMSWAYPYGGGFVTNGFPFGFDRFNRFNKSSFNRIPGFGFNQFNKFSPFNSGIPTTNFRGRLLFSFPKPAGGAPGGGGGHRGNTHGGGGGFRGRR
jgi:hypothetical protein